MGRRRGRRAGRPRHAHRPRRAGLGRGPEAALHLLSGVVNEEVGRSCVSRARIRVRERGFHGHFGDRGSHGARDPCGRARLRLAVDGMQRRRRLREGRRRAHRRTSEDARPARGSDDAALGRPGAGFRFNRRSTAAQRAGQGQARGRPRGDRRHDRRLQGADRAGRPAGRAHGRLRLGDEPGPDRLLDHRDDRPQDQHAGA